MLSPISLLVQIQYHFSVSSNCLLKFINFFLQFLDLSLKILLLVPHLACLLLRFVHLLLNIAKKELLIHRMNITNFSSRCHHTLLACFDSLREFFSIILIWLRAKEGGSRIIEWKRDRCWRPNSKWWPR